MANDLFFATAVLWALAFLAALAARSAVLARILLVLGCCAGIAGCLVALPAASPVHSIGIDLNDTTVHFQFDAAACWLLLFGLIAAVFACGLATPTVTAARRRYWLAGLAATLLGAFGVFGFQDAMSFLIAWEVMSVGGAVLLLTESRAPSGRPVLFMLALLEVGAVAVLLALLLLGNHAGAFNFPAFVAAPFRAGAGGWFIAMLLLFGFGAKLGVLPFYEWFPGAYGSGSGATGVIFSGTVLNAAFFALARGVLVWLPHTGNWMLAAAIITVFAGIISAILAIFNAFQENDWRRILSLSSAENAGVAVGILGVSLLFLIAGLPAPAALAWIVCLIHLAGHSLAKGTLFLTADGVFSIDQSYRVEQNGILRHTSVLFGIGALFAAMSLAALPPQIGFASEWYAFQTLFQGMQMSIVGARLTLALAAAGLALVAAVALATFAKLFGVGLLGAGRNKPSHISFSRYASVFVLGVFVLALAVSLPWSVQALGRASQAMFGANAPAQMKDAWLLVPLNGKFAFISPTKLVIAGPLLALLPIALYVINRWARKARRVPLWSGGRREDTRSIATTSLAFSNALRTFYSFIYTPTHDLERESEHGPYFVQRLIFNQNVAPIFTPRLFNPIVRFVRALAAGVSVIQSGYLNFYNAMIGALLVLILTLSLFYR